MKILSSFLLFWGITIGSQGLLANNLEPGDLSPIDESHWDYRKAAHLMERAGFGGTPSQITALSKMSPSEAVASFLKIPEGRKELSSFQESGAYDDGIDPFPSSRPEATRLAKKNGQAIGVKVKQSGNRRLQPVVDRFFYWLRASRLETHRLGYWWANQMLTSEFPLQEKMSLFWHGHFATSEIKVRDYRKMLQQNKLFRQKGLGEFRLLLIGVSQDPAMLNFLDAGVNIKGSPNENFAREIMELFTMGEGHYSEFDIREAARAFTGWNYKDLDFVVNADQHDETEKQFLGVRGNLNGIDVIDIILSQKATADFLSSKLYCYFVRDNLSEQTKNQLSQILTDNNYNISKFLETIFLSKDFYSDASVGTKIRSPIELVVSTYKKLGLNEIPGVPDFNVLTENLGQKLFYPPTVAGWSSGRSWITPGLLLARGNFVYDLVFPDINFIPPDRFPTSAYKIGPINDKLAEGLDVTNATRPEGTEISSNSMLMADRDEDFNTRLGSYRGWQLAIQKIKPIPRNTAQIDLTRMVMAENLTSTADVVSYLIGRFLAVPVKKTTILNIAGFLEKELGTNSLKEAESYMEQALRLTLHIILSLPEYQLS